MAVLEPELAVESAPAVAPEIEQVVSSQVDWHQEREQMQARWLKEREDLTAQWKQEREELTIGWNKERADLEQEAAAQGARNEAEKADLQQRISEVEDKAAEAELELELTQKQASDLQERLDDARREIEAETAQITHLQDELGELMRRVESKEAAHEKLLSNIQDLEQSLQDAQDRCQTMEGEAEELELLKEDLEETIVDRRRELKALRLSENEARAYAEECKVFRVEAEQKIQIAQAEQERLRTSHEQELGQLEERLERSRLRQEELVGMVEAARQSASQDDLKEAERRHMEAERQLIQVRGELDSLKKDGGDRERLERRCLLLENDLKAANQELMSLERSQARWETEKQELSEEITRLKTTAPSPFVAPAGGAVSGGADEGELRQWKLRADDLREALRKQRTENERLQERVDVLIKAKELEEKQRKEVESRLRTALRIQARQQQGY